MKKCASCSKDLPEAALHCVFCGAKQPLAPVQPAQAKTAFGYSANEVMAQLGNPQQSYQQPQAPRASRPSAPGYSPPKSPIDPSDHDAATVLVPTASSAGNFANQQAYAATDYGGAPSPFAGPSNPAPGYGAQAPSYGSQPASPYGAPAPSPYGVPAAPPNASTQPPAAPYGAASPYAPQPQAYGNPSPGYGAPQPQAYGNPMGPAPAASGMGIHSSHQPTPQPLPTAPSPYLGHQASARADWPLDPWKDSIKLVMFIWGAVALVTFATPTHLDPLGFNWDLITDGVGKQKLPPLLWSAAGLLSIACAAIPMPTLPRGLIAAALGLAGIFVPIFVLGAVPPWQLLVPLVAMMVLVPALLVRDEYTESIVPRILVTVGVVAVLITVLIPQHGQIPLVTKFKGLIEAPGKEKIEFIVDILFVVLVVMTLLVWMPGPATGGAKLFAWALIVFPILEFAVKLVVGGHVGELVSKSPGDLVEWAPDAVYSVLSGYGLATIIGKQLE